MALTTCRVWPILAIVYSCFGGAEALILEKNHKLGPETVCISIAAYEKAEWVDALINNAIRFSEPTTKIVVHLNANSKYSDQELARWETPRVSLSPQRVPVRPFQGSILYAHMLNAKHMEARWPNECSFWVMQHSNMMWVRRGFEDEIRKRRFSQIVAREAPGACSANIPLHLEAGAPKHIYARGQAEGAFFPMKTVKGFLAFMDRHLQAHHDNGTSIVTAPCFLEEFTLQTYAANCGDFTDEEVAAHRSKASNVAWRHYGLFAKSNDSVPEEEIRAIVEAKEGWDYYFAVKRVNRKLDHPITRFILSLSR